jgi:hypothetical protein
MEKTERCPTQEHLHRICVDIALAVQKVPDSVLSWFLAARFPLSVSFHRWLFDLQKRSLVLVLSLFVNAVGMT